MTNFLRRLPKWICFLAALGGCAAPRESSPGKIAIVRSGNAPLSRGVSFPPPSANAALSGVISAQGAYDAAPVFLMRAGEHRFAMYATDRNGRLKRDGGFSESLLLFEDERFLGSIPESGAFDFESCLAQTDGTALLAARLRSIAAGQPDPLAEPLSDGGSAVGMVRCPDGLDATAGEGARTGRGKGAPSELSQGAAEALFYSAGLILAPIVVPLGVAAAGAGMFSDEGDAQGMQSAHAGEDERILAAQRQIAAGTTAAELDSLMPKPTLRFVLQPANTEVRYFKRKRLLSLWVGIQDDHVAWLRFGSHSTSEWLERVVQKQRRRE